MSFNLTNKLYLDTEILGNPLNPSNQRSIQYQKRTDGDTFKGGL